MTQVEIRMTKTTDTCLKLLEESCLTLFSVYGVETLERVSKPQNPENQEIFLGFIGFTHANMRGALAITTTQELLGETAHGASPKDWIGELANQLLGRFKNKLLSYDVVLRVSTPIAMSGCSLSIASEPEHLYKLYYETPFGMLHVHLDLDMNPNFELIRVSSIGEELPDEGEPLFF